MLGIVGILLSPALLVDFVRRVHVLQQHAAIMTGATCAPFEIEVVRRWSNRVGHGAIERVERLLLHLQEGRLDDKVSEAIMPG